MRSKKNRLPVGKRNLRVELEATSDGTRTATIAIDVSFINYSFITLTSGTFQPGSSARSNIAESSIQ